MLSKPSSAPEAKNMQCTLLVTKYTHFSHPTYPHQESCNPGPVQYHAESIALASAPSMPGSYGHPHLQKCVSP